MLRNDMLPKNHYGIDRLFSHIPFQRRWDGVKVISLHIYYIIQVIDNTS